MTVALARTVMAWRYGMGLHKRDVTSTIASNKMSNKFIMALMDIRATNVLTGLTLKECYQHN